jgi:hypothetical protein
MSMRSIWSPFIALFVLMVLSCGDAVKEEKNKETLALEKEARHKEQLAVITDQLQEGDLLLREGTDFSSEQAKSFSIEDKTYSHAGIAVKEHHRWKVIHIVPDHYHIQDKVRMEGLDSFANPNDNASIALARYQLDRTQVDSLTKYLRTQYERQVIFDGNFDLDTDDAMYCSEMISKGLAFASGKKLQIESIRFQDKTKLKLIKKYYGWGPDRALNKVIIPIDRLYKHPQCTFITRVVFE